jgi:hypothetical protein
MTQEAIKATQLDGSFLLVTCLASILKTVATRYSETSGNFYWTARYTSQKTVIAEIISNSTFHEHT